MEQILSIALGQDVSKLAAREKQLLLSRLLARLAHEVLNPLSSLDVHVQLLQEDLAQAAPPVKEQTVQRLEIIRGELRRLETVVKHFLSLAGPSALELQSIQLGKIIHHVCELLRPEAAARGIEIKTRMNASVPPLMADPVQLTQALLNLVINAIQAVENQGWIEVGAHHDSEKGVVAIEVRDTGPGVPPEKRSAIFDPFFTTKAEGSGLGLWVVQQIVTAHGGVATATNAPEGGAVFAMYLPTHRKEEGDGQS